jgi:hypothetical protein
LGKIITTEEVVATDDAEGEDAETEVVTLDTRETDNIYEFSVGLFSENNTRMRFSSTLTHYSSFLLINEAGNTHEYGVPKPSKLLSSPISPLPLCPSDRTRYASETMNLPTSKTNGERNIAAYGVSLLNNQSADVTMTINDNLTFTLSPSTASASLTHNDTVYLKTSGTILFPADSYYAWCWYIDLDNTCYIAVKDLINPKNTPDTFIFQNDMVDLVETLKDGEYLSTVNTMTIDGAETYRLVTNTVQKFTSDAFEKALKSFYVGSGFIAHVTPWTTLNLYGKLDYPPHINNSYVISQVPYIKLLTNATTKAFSCTFYSYARYFATSILKEEGDRMLVFQLMSNNFSFLSVEMRRAAGNLSEMYVVFHHNHFEFKISDGYDNAWEFYIFYINNICEIQTSTNEKVFLPNTIPYEKTDIQIRAHWCLKDVKVFDRYLPVHHLSSNSESIKWSPPPPSSIAIAAATSESSDSDAAAASTGDTAGCM